MFQLVRPQAMGGLEWHRDTMDVGMHKELFVASLMLLSPLGKKSTMIAGAEEETVLEHPGSMILFDPDTYHRSGLKYHPNAVILTVFMAKRSDLQKIKDALRAAAEEKKQQEMLRLKS